MPKIQVERTGRADPKGPPPSGQTDRAHPFCPVEDRQRHVGAEVPRAPYPAAVAVTRTVSAQALVAFRGNTYSVPPGMTGRELTVRSQLGQPLLEVATEAGVVLARHHRAPDGAGAVIRDAGHVTALEHAVLAAFSDRAACRGKTRRPPSAAARAQAARLRGEGEPAAAPGTGQVVDFAAYAAVAPITGSRVGQDAQ